MLTPREGKQTSHQLLPLWQNSNQEIRTYWTLDENNIKKSSEVHNIWNCFYFDLSFACFFPLLLFESSFWLSESHFLCLWLLILLQISEVSPLLELLLLLFDLPTFLFDAYVYLTFSFCPLDFTIFRTPLSSLQVASD